MSDVLDRRKRRPERTGSSNGGGIDFPSRTCADDQAAHQNQPT